MTLRPLATSCAKDYKGHSLVQTSFTEPPNITCWYKAKDLKSELRSCVQVEVAVLSSSSLISLVVSAGVKQHLKNEAKDIGCQSPGEERHTKRKHWRIFLEAQGRAIIRPALEPFERQGWGNFCDSEIGCSRCDARAFPSTQTPPCTQT